MLNIKMRLTLFEPTQDQTAVPSFTPGTVLVDDLTPLSQKQEHTA